MKRPALDYVADGALIALCVLGAALIFTPRGHAADAFPHCDWQKSFALLKSDKRFGEPVTATDRTALQLAAIANLNPSKQAMIVPVYGETREQLRLVVITCGPNENWTPRHFMIDAEAERRFYNLAPPNLDVPDELPKPQKRTRKAAP